MVKYHAYLTLDALSIAWNRGFDGAGHLPILGGLHIVASGFKFRGGTGASRLPVKNALT